MKTSLVIKGMSCGHCVSGVAKALRAIDGVETAEVDLSTGTASVSHDRAITLEMLVKAVAEEGYAAEVK